MIIVYITLLRHSGTSIGDGKIMTEEDILRAMEENISMSMEEVVQGPCQDLRDGVDDPQKLRERSVREYSQPKSFAVCRVFSV